jgi:hypothetical protein
MLAEILAELRALTREIRGLRRDLKKRDDRDQADRKEGELVTLTQPRRKLSG